MQAGAICHTILSFRHQHTSSARNSVARLKMGNGDNSGKSGTQPQTLPSGLHFCTRWGNAAPAFTENNDVAVGPPGPRLPPLQVHTPTAGGPARWWRSAAPQRRRRRCADPRSKAVRARPSARRSGTGLHAGPPAGRLFRGPSRAQAPTGKGQVTAAGAAGSPCARLGQPVGAGQNSGGARPAEELAESPAATTPSASPGLPAPGEALQGGGEPATAAPKPARRGSASKRPGTTACGSTRRTISSTCTSAATPRSIRPG